MSCGQFLVSTANTEVTKKEIRVNPRQITFADNSFIMNALSSYYTGHHLGSRGIGIKLSLKGFLANAPFHELIKIKGALMKHSILSLLIAVFMISIGSAYTLENDFIRNLKALREKSQGGTQDLYILWDAYGSTEQKNAGLVKYIWDEYNGGTYCEMSKMTIVKILWKEYRMFVGDGTGDCDGGNFYGIVLDWTSLREALKEDRNTSISSMTKMLVAVVRDGDIYVEEHIHD